MKREGALLVEAVPAFLQFDWHNAFESPRGAHMVALKTHVPDAALFDWICDFLRAPTQTANPHHLLSVDSSLPMIAPSADGIAHGDLLSALLSSMTITHSLAQAMSDEVNLLEAVQCSSTLTAGGCRSLVASLLVTLGQHGLSVQPASANLDSTTDA